MSFAADIAKFFKSDFGKEENKSKKTSENESGFSKNVLKFSGSIDNFIQNVNAHDSYYTNPFLISQNEPTIFDENSYYSDLEYFEKEDSLFEDYN